MDPIHSGPSTRDDGPPVDSPAERYRRQWTNGRPDLDAFLASAGPLGADELAAVLRVDQRQRWRAGDRVPAEEYLRRLPAGPSGTEAAVDLVFNEYLLREQRGERPDADQFIARFPDHQAALRDQLAFHRVLATADTATGDAPTGPSDDRSATDTTDELPLPRTFGRYEIVRLLGSGGMGFVCLARDTALDRLVALKVPRFADYESSAAERFRREARVAAVLRHPNLCPVFDVGRVGGIDYLTMPFLSGETLSARVRRSGPLPERDAAGLIVRIARGLETAHQAGIVHRDLKPANILVDEKGEPVVTDFGLARRVGPADPRLTESGATIGTPAYAPPEQIGCDPDSLGPRCDVYSLGVVLYELLAGRAPYTGSSREVLQKVLSGQPDPPSRYRPGLDPKLEAICLRAMAKAPENRFASMAEFATALEGWLDKKPTSLPARRIGARSVAAIIASVILLGGLLLWRPWRNVPGEASGNAQAARARTDRAWELNDADQMDAAIEECNAALRLDDRCATALICRANAYIKKSLFALAVADLNRAIALDPSDATGYIDRAWAHNRSGDHGRALADADQAIRLRNDSAEGYYQRGGAYHGLGKFQQAVDDFTHAIRLQPDYIWAHRARSHAYRALGQTELADQDVEKVRQLDAASRDDLFSAESHWLGTFRFGDPVTNQGTVSLRVTRRSGDDFDAVYTTTEGEQEFRWRVTGTARGGRIECRIVAWLAGGGDSPGLVGHGRVVGTYRGEQMTVTFSDSRDQSSAKMELKLQK